MELSKGSVKIKKKKCPNIILVTLYFKVGYVPLVNVILFLIFFHALPIKKN
jgi:hypothetical protein